MDVTDHPRSICWVDFRTYLNALAEVNRVSDVNIPAPRVLVCCPRLSGNGGVSNYYRVIKRELASDRLSFHEVGGEGASGGRLLWAIVFEPLSFIWVLLRRDPDLVHLNPSLQMHSVIRNLVYALIARMFGKKLVIFWRGWNLDVEKKIMSRYKRIFRWIFDAADATLVLAHEFRLKLKAAGFTSPVIVSTTVYDEKKLAEQRVERLNTQPRLVQCMIMSRLVENKGIEECLNAVTELRCLGLPIVLDIAGDGELLSKIKEKYGKAEYIRLHGHVYDDKKYRLLSRSDIFLFPSTYGEGMPNSVLEAMASGCVILATRVGGLADFFEEDIHGKVLNKGVQEEIVTSIRQLLSDDGAIERISGHNATFAHENFSASVVSARLRRIYEAVHLGQVSNVPKSWLRCYGAVS